MWYYCTCCWIFDKAPEIRWFSKTSQIWTVGYLTERLSHEGEAVLPSNSSMPSLPCAYEQYMIANQHMSQGIRKADDELSGLLDHSENRWRLQAQSGTCVAWVMVFVTLGPETGADYPSQLFRVWLSYLGISTFLRSLLLYLRCHESKGMHYLSSAKTEMRCSTKVSWKLFKMRQVEESMRIRSKLQTNFQTASTTTGRTRIA